MAMRARFPGRCADGDDIVPEDARREVDEAQ
jgi:hypothetical protein